MEKGIVMHDEVQKTPLYEAHAQAGGKLINFHGWLLPVQYGSGILKEHQCVRTAAGLFDVSHMGELEVTGPDALNFLQMLLTNDIDAKPGKAVYSPMCYPDGGTVDDLISYKLSDEKYLLVVNASNTLKDYQWLLKNKKGNITITNRSAEYSQLAVQGPNACAILREMTKEDIDNLRPYSFIDEALVGKAKVIISRTGYTGEDGFELYCRPEDAEMLWKTLLYVGQEYGLAPAGLGARDTLRLEASLPLYGQELSEKITPAMAGLKRFIKPDKGEFIGKEPLAKQMKEGSEQKIAGFEMLDRAVPRNGYEVYSSGARIGHVTSGGFFPTVKKNMGFALIKSDCAVEGNTIEVKVRDALYAAKIVKLPFYKRK